MSREARALPTSPDGPSVSKPRTTPGTAERWRDLFGSDAPHAAGFIEQAIAWREQVLIHGDVAPAIARDLAIAARHAGEGTAPPSSAAPRSMSEPDPDPSAASRSISVTGNDPVAPGRSAAPRSGSRATPAPLPPASSQLLPGARLVKAYGGRNHVVQVTDTGFVYEGAVFASLSAVAKHITGTHWNGLLFFGLRRRKTYPIKAAANG